MKDFIEVTGKTVDDALTNALIRLETTSDKIEYEVLDKGSIGILGIFNSKPAKIKVRRKNTTEDNVREFLDGVLETVNEVTGEIFRKLSEDERPHGSI